MEIETYHPGPIRTPREILEVIYGSLGGIDKKVMEELLQDEAETRKLECLLSRPNCTKQSCLYSVLYAINSRALECNYRIFSGMFSSVDTEFGKSLAKKSVDALGLSSSVNTELTYGEIDFHSFASILQRISPADGSVFVDLGHGTGKALVCAWLLYGNNFSRIHGVELLEDLYLQSETIIDVARQRLLASEDLPSAIVTTCQGDLLASTEQGGGACKRGTFYDWGLADVVFANSTCFSDELMVKLSEQAANRMKSGAIFITLTHPLRGIGSTFALEGQYQYAMSWGTATCNIHRKL